MKLFNTLTRKKEEFIPLEKNKVKMYVCGPTVYDYIHIGNARAFVVFDCLRRYLEHKGYDVTYVQNFTDVDDKIINKANAENVTMEEIAERFTKEAIFDTESLNIKKPTFTPKVTEEIKEIIEIIQTLIDKGYAYEVAGNVYFSTTKYADYGFLSKRNLDELNIGSRVAANEDKKDKTDFVLWKPKKENEPYWDSPWGKGRPGWHIECSAMAKKYLGETIDIHAGGEDLIFPHHENEIAQSQCANDKKFANYFVHNGFVNVDNEKMSKSLGNFFTVREITKEYDYMLIRFFLLSAHYKSPINFSRELLESAKAALARIETCVNNLKFVETNSNAPTTNEAEADLLKHTHNYTLQFEKAMDDDLNTADAIAAIFDFVRFINTNVTESSSKEFVTNLQTTLENLCHILGIKFETKTDTLDTEIEDLIQQRQDAKQTKDFAKADQIRALLLEKGVVLEDTRAGVRWKRL